MPATCATHAQAYPRRTSPPVKTAAAIVVRIPRDPVWRARVSAALGVAIGAGVALAGFPPFSNANTVLGLEERPWIVVAMPALLIACTALCAALVAPARRQLPGARLFAAGSLLLLVGAVVSILGSGDPSRSGTLVVLAISAPVLLFVGLVHTRLSPRWLAAGFLLGLAVMLIRADAVFIREWGLPGPAQLQAAKYQSIAYDFHYYTLGNPDHTAGFLLMSLCLASFWCGGRALRGWQRGLLAGSAALSAFTLVLTYARAAIGTAIALVVLLVLVLPASRRTRLLLTAAVAAATAVLIIGTLDYVSTLLNTDRSASVPERLASLEDGLVTLAHHPVTGVGLGEYATGAGYFPAHSSIIQAGAEMGVLGLCALVVLTVAVCAHAVRGVRAQGWFDLRTSAGLAVAVYALHAAMAAPASSALFSGYITVWGLTASLLLAVSFMSAPEPP